MTSSNGSPLSGTGPAAAPKVQQPSVADIVFMLAAAPGFNDETAEESLSQRGFKGFFSSPWAWMAKREQADPRVRGINVLIWGPPGMGKTEMVKSLMKKMNRNVYKKDLSKDLPEDVKGIPKAVKERKTWWKFWKADLYTLDAPNRFLMAAKNDPNACIVLDDLTNATQAVQAAGLSLVLNREFEDGKGGTFSLRHAPIIAMANHGSAASMTELLSPVANRFVHLFAEPTDIGTPYWLGEQALHVDPEKLKTLDERWNAQYMKNWAICSAFVRHYERELTTFVNAANRTSGLWQKDPDDFTDVHSYAWCTPRSLEFAARCMTIFDLFSDENVRFDDRRVLEGAIGRTAALQLIEFRNQLKLPQVDDVYNRTIDWGRCNTAHRVLLPFEAARQAQTPEQVQAVVDGMQAVEELAGGSQDLVKLTKDVLIQRARGVLPSLPMSQDVVKAVQEAFPDAWSKAPQRRIALPSGAKAVEFEPVPVGWPGPPDSSAVRPMPSFRELAVVASRKGATSPAARQGVELS